MLLHPYNPIWKTQFSDLKSVIDSTLGPDQFWIEHIGSTAVPGMDAKPIIDMDVIYYEMEDFTIINENLKTLGYYHNGDQGVPGREVFKRQPGQNHEILDTIPHHLYVCKANSSALQRHLAFRNYLLDNKDAREQYTILKREIAAKAKQDKKVYAGLKGPLANPFIDDLLKQSKN